MYAVVSQGGKQHLVRKGQVLKVEKIKSDVGSEFSIQDVKFAIDDKGKPVYKGASVKAEVISQERDQKLVIFKKRRRKNYRRKSGHRQYNKHGF